MTALNPNPVERTAGRAVRTGFRALVLCFGALVLARALSEGTYDLAFANLALDLSGLVTTVGLVYFVGYGVEVIASVVAGPLLDRHSPLRAVIGAYGVKILLFGLIGLGSSFLATHLWTIVLAAALVDLVHHVGDMALFVLLPRVLTPGTLVRVQGIGASVRAAGEVVSPLAAGAVLALLPGARALLAAAVFQVLALFLLFGLLAVIRRGRSGEGAGA
ncbi:hypothetical protein, partial [Streptomyces calidiresistens]